MGMFIVRQAYNVGSASVSAAIKSLYQPRSIVAERASAIPFIRKAINIAFDASFLFLSTPEQAHNEEMQTD